MLPARRWTVERGGGRTSLRVLRPVGFPYDWIFTLIGNLISPYLSLNYHSLDSNVGLSQGLKLIAVEKTDIDAKGVRFLRNSRL